MRLVERMTNHPPVCLHCGAGNTEDAEGELMPALDLEREVNWGDSTYICGKCCGMIAALYGYIAEEQYKDLTQTIESLKEKLHEVKAALEEKDRRTKAIIAGREAITAEKKDQRKKVSA